MLYNGSMSDDVPSTKQLNIVRTSTLTPSGEFENENLLKHIVPWQQKTVRIALNMLRLIRASVVRPQRFGSFVLGLTYSDDFTWDQVNYLFSPENNGVYRLLTLFKNGDSVKDTASFFIVDINANWTLAPDLLIITTTKSSWDGLFSSTHQTIQEVPHASTLDEATKLQQFFIKRY
ncbi:unnamed protein product [Rotaria sp. Silwood1]|nr:unnamed protein product [Rotaria sp. Silwood1]CAF3729042.1 unnamed protein product [Rotaria sp. Silwood1]CAF3773321.1 unnamed protein product [Rotaria sp. Silwood1]CAF4720187.1 unnamed protein product [Rotaria sp. Silwood1]CAF4885147.1 unnamed protein product [Rotaria sp. Silwood1]